MYIEGLKRKRPVPGYEAKVTPTIQKKLEIVEYMLSLPKTASRGMAAQQAFPETLGRRKRFHPGKWIRDAEVQKWRGLRPPDNTHKEKAEKIIEIMEAAVELKVPNKVDYESGANWGEIK